MCTNRPLNHRLNSRARFKMPASYSTDFRWRIVWLNLAHGESPAVISLKMCISEKSVRRYLKLFYTTGDVKPKTHKHGPPALLGDFEQLTLLRLILDNTGIYLHELQHMFYEIFGVTVSLSTICKTLRLMGCSRRVIRHVAIQ